jgi:hypothetical protein
LHEGAASEYTTHTQDKPPDPGALPTIAQMKVIKHLGDDLSEYFTGANCTAFERALIKMSSKFRPSASRPNSGNKVNEVLNQHVQRDAKGGKRP